jgi:hypothetical protein
MPSDSKGPASGELYAFLALALMVLVLSVDVIGLLGIGASKPSATQNAAPQAINAWKSLDADGRQLLSKEHDAVVSEIQMRLGQEHLLFSLKFGLVGAILWAFLQTPAKTGAQFETTPFAALAAWSAVVAAAIVDWRLTSNQSFVMTLGGWTRQYEQLALGPTGAPLGWESFVADNLHNEPYYPALRVSGQILTALLFCLTSSIFLMRPEGQSDPRTARICGAGAVVSLFIMTMAAISMRRDRYAVLLYIAAGIVAVGLAGFLVHASHVRNRAVAPHSPVTPATLA